MSKISLSQIALFKVISTSDRKVNLKILTFLRHWTPCAHYVLGILNLHAERISQAGAMFTKECTQMQSGREFLQIGLTDGRRLSHLSVSQDSEKTGGDEYEL